MGKQLLYETDPKKKKKKTSVTVLDIWKTIETRRKDIHSRNYSSHIFTEKNRRRSLFASWRFIIEACEPVAYQKIKERNFGKLYSATLSMFFFLPWQQ